MSEERMVASLSKKLARNERRKVLRALNNSVWDGAENVIALSKSLDTSFKKNTTFIKRCRTGLKDSDALVKDVCTLSLDKYLTEIIPALAEGLSKYKNSAEFFCGIEVASALHQRFGAMFSATLISLFLSGIYFPSKYDLANMTKEEVNELRAEALPRHKIILRCILELWLVGIFRSVSDVIAARQEVPAYAKRSKDGIIAIPPLTACHLILVNEDKETFANSEILVALVKNYSDLLVDGSDACPLDDLITQTVRDDFKLEFDTYRHSFEKSLASTASKICSQHSYNENTFLKIGKSLESKSSILESMQEQFDICHKRYTNLCEVLHWKPQEYDTSPPVENSMAINIANFEQDSIWEDDEQKRFYETLPDIFFGERKDISIEEDAEQSEEGGKEASDQKDLMDQLSQIAHSAATSNTPATSTNKNIKESQDDADDDGRSVDDFESDGEDQDQKPDDITNSPLRELLITLTSHPSRDLVDTVAKEYTKLDGKASRNFVVKQLTKGLSFHNMFQLPFVARFIAIVNSFAPEITAEILEYLADFFRYLQKKRNIRALTSRRSFVLYYVSELTKFGLTTKYYIGSFFIKMTGALDDSNAESLSILLEGCGRYVVRKPRTADLMAKILGTLQKQIRARYISLEARIPLEAALDYIQPRVKYEKKEKIRPQMELFIRELVYHQLNGDTVEEVLTELRKLNWNDQDTFKALKKVFIKIHKVNYSNIELMAWLLYTLSHYYRSFVVIVADALMEDIRRLLDLSNFKYSQQRIAQVKYLGQLYRYGLVGEEVIFNTLYMLVTYGHPDGKPQAGKYNRWDPPDDLFRIRLICALLESPELATLLGSNARSKSMLNLFLKLFFYYVLTKQSLSIDVEFCISDMLNKVQPGSTLPKTLSEAVRELEIALGGEESKKESIENESKSSLLKQPSGKQKGHGTSYTRGGYGIKIDENDQNGTLTPEELEAERKREEKLRKSRIAQENLKAEDEFEREFQKLMMGRLDGEAITDQTSAQKKEQVFNAPIPILQQSRESDRAPDVGHTVKYQLMTKKAGTARAEIRAVDLPGDLKFISAIATERAKRSEEQGKIKNFVMDYVSRPDVDSNVVILPAIIQPEVASTRYSKKPSKILQRKPVQVPDVPPELKTL